MYGKTEAYCCLLYSEFWYRMLPKVPMLIIIAQKLRIFSVSMPKSFIKLGLERGYCWVCYIAKLNILGDVSMVLKYGYSRFSILNNIKAKVLSNIAERLGVVDTHMGYIGCVVPVLKIGDVVPLVGRNNQYAIGL